MQTREPGFEQCNEAVAAVCGMSLALGAALARLVSTIRLRIKNLFFARQRIKHFKLLYLDLLNEFVHCVHIALVVRC